MSTVAESTDDSDDSEEESTGCKAPPVSTPYNAQTSSQTSAGTSRSVSRKRKSSSSLAMESNQELLAALSKPVRHEFTPTTIRTSFQQAIGRANEVLEKAYIKANIVKINRFLKDSDNAEMIVSLRNMSETESDEVEMMKELFNSLE